MNFEWKVINAEIFTEAEQALNQLDQAKYEVVSTHTFQSEGRAFLSIIVRKPKPTQNIRY